MSEDIVEFEEVDTSVSSGTITNETKKMVSEAGEKVEETKYIRTGNVGIDMLLSKGKGLPVGGSILLWAEPGVGKTTIIADIGKRLIDIYKANGKPYKVLYLAVEGSRQLIRNVVGEYLDTGDFMYIEKPLCWRNVEGFFNAVLNKHPKLKDVKMIVIDSVQNVLSDSNVEKSVADGDYGTKARERSSFYSKYLPLCYEAGISTFLVSQVRHNQDAGLFGPKKKSAANDTDKHNVDVIVRCGTLLSSKDSEKVKVKTIFKEEEFYRKYVVSLSTQKSMGGKNRYVGDTASQVLLVNGRGVDDSYVIRKILESRKLSTDAGGWYTFSEKFCKELPNLPTKKMRREEMNATINDNIEDIKKYLIDNDLYTLEISTEVVSGEEE